MMKKQNSMSMSIPQPNKKKIKNHQLPNEIISEILLRLPIKTLFHCLLVCKNWLSLISTNPHFAYLHLSISPINLLIKPINRNQLRLIDLQMIHHKKGYPQETQLKLIPNINFPLLGSQILNSCNGLLCLLGSSEIFVCNPILGQYIVFLYPNDGIFDKRIFAFGFSSKTNQYKVILFYYDDDDEDDDDPIIDEQYTTREEVYAKIYTIGEGSWRDLGRVPFYLKNRYFNSFLNGAFHWLNFTPDPAAADPDFIQCFDFESELFRVVPGPPEFGLHEEVVVSNRMQLGVLQGSLSLCDFSSYAHIDIWIMRDYGIKESWTNIFVIEKVNIGNKWGNLDSYEPIMILKSGDVLMLCNKNVLVLYNPKMGSFKKQNIHGIKSEFQATAHIPTFVSLQDFARAERVVSFDMLLKNKGCRDYHFLEALLGSRTSFQ